MEIKILAYSDGNDFPNRRQSFFRRHWKALLLACVVIILGIATLTSIATRTANQPSFTPDSPYVYDGAAAHLDDSSISMNGAPLRFERHDHPSDLLVQSLHRTLDILVDLIYEILIDELDDMVLHLSDIADGFARDQFAALD